MLPYDAFRLFYFLFAELGSERDSPRDQLVVTLFLLTVFGLLLGAGIKSRLMKAGISADVSASWNAGRRWWEVSSALVALFSW